MRFSILIPVFHLLAIVVAQSLNTSSGIGRYTGTSLLSSLQFSPAAFSEGIQSIVSTLNVGPNRSHPFPPGLDKIYGVNIGNWLIFEPWMAPGEWKSMGGEYCGDCTKCIQSEWQLATALGQNRTNSVFQQHWETWFTQSDVDDIISYNLNTVRIPLGFWIVEGIVNRKTEPYAQGGITQLIRGLEMLSKAGIWVILDHHALPGVAADEQMFAGNCTNEVHFYQDSEYQRAVTWAAVMTYLTHVHPAFSTVFAIEAVNEPIQNYADTPDLADYEKSFVLAVRSVELALGIVCDTSFVTSAIPDNITMNALQAAAPIIFELSLELGLNPIFAADQNPFEWPISPGVLGNLVNQKQCVATNFMNRDWQYTTNPSQVIPNPARYAKGPQIYDNHLYFSFGGVAAANEQSYLSTICKLSRTAQAASIGDAPLFFGEWSLATNFDASNGFLQQWGDAQKLIYGASAGWIFWNFKIDQDADAVPLQWSYEQAVASGMLTKDARGFINSSVCADYMG